MSNPIVLYDNNQLGMIAFASSGWEGGITLLDPKSMESKIYANNEIGPVHKEMTMAGDGVFITDNYGSLHYLSTKSFEISASIQLSCNPLSTATTVDDSMIIVGSYDTRLYCVRYDKEQRKLRKIWECDCYSSICSTPLKLRDRSVVACTTAGHIIKISTENGKIQCSRRIPAEVWSSPVQVGQKNIVAVGARDSKCHLITI